MDYQKQNIYHQIDYLLHINFNIPYCNTTIIQFCDGKNKKAVGVVCVIYDRNSICIFIVPILDRQNLRKFEQTFQQCKYNNNNLASIQFRIVYSVSKVRTVGKLFVSSGLHLNRITKTTTSIHLSIYQFVCLFHVYFWF